MALFDRTSIGLDICDTSLEVVELKKSGKEFKVLAFNRRELPDGIVEGGRIKDAKALAAAIKDLLASAQPQAIKNTDLEVFLSENQVYTLSASLPSDGKSVKDDDLDEIVEQRIPHDIEDLVYRHKIRSSAAGKSEVLVVAAAKTIVQEWNNFFKKNNFGVSRFDIEILADARGVLANPPTEPVCLVDIGKRSTAVGVFDQNGLAYSYSILQAGDTLSARLAQDMKITIQDAEKKKISAGLTGKGPQAKTSEILTGILTELAQDLQDVFIYLQAKHGWQINKVILVGGTSQLRGLPEFLTEFLKKEVILGEPAPAFRFPSGYDKDSQRFYLGALGVAARDLSDQWSDDPLIPVESGRTLRKAAAAIQIIPEPLSSDEAAEVPVIKQTWIQAHRKEMMIAGIAIGAVLLLLGAYFFQKISREQRQKALQGPASQYTFNEQFDVKIPVYVAGEAVLSAARGQLVTRQLENLDQVATFYTQSKGDAMLAAGEGIFLWDQPVKITDADGELLAEEIAKLAQGDATGLKLPVTINWLLFSSDDAQGIALGVIGQQLKDQEFLFESVDYTNVEKLRGLEVFILTVQTNISLKTASGLMGPLMPADFNPEIFSQPVAPVVDTRSYVVITPTPTGTLNVRSGAGSTFPIVGKAKPGEKYQLLNEQGSWYHIQFSETVDGWIAAQYAKKQ